ncbi:MAG TPA: hypothetical protein ENI17_00285 [Pseudomonas xinjiangensis]|uniref:KilA-N DNA-binding domain-containing protein n=2 Tax=root TaxID=1 RepID=A0A7V1FTH2_9GAMM|nr:hypothetical protein [Halopseudomonas xinjiangensis]HEC46059.1 hypothetical protein [Halopseudomonas xinjiangensis]
MSEIVPIRYADTDTLSLRQIDELSGFIKGSSFRIFKACEAQLQEGADYYYLPADQHQALIESLKASGQIYGSTVNLLLMTRNGYERMQKLVSG